MLARQDRHLVALLDLVDADGALGLPLWPEHFVVHSFLIEAFDGRLRCGRRGVGLGRRLHKLRDDAVKRLLRVDRVAVDRGFRVVQRAQEALKSARKGSGERHSWLWRAAVLPVWVPGAGPERIAEELLE
jgi:hypothetical protein